MAPMLALTVVLLLGAGGAPASPVPSATPKQPLRIIGRVHAVTTFCKAFETHFNGAVGPLLAGDAQLSYVNYTLGEIEPHYRARAPELLLYDDRVKLIAYLKVLFAQISQAQGEINALRETAKSVSDPQTAKETRELASQLQRALDKQHQLAIDSLGVAHAMIDVATKTNLTWVPSMGDAGGDPGPPASTQVTSVVPGGYDPSQNLPTAMRDVRNVLSFSRQLDRIGDAEGNAAQTAGAIASGC